MSGIRVLVVEHQENAGLGLFGKRLRALGAQVTQVGPDAGAEIPETLEGFDALIVLGGSMGPLEDQRAPWLPATRKLLLEGVSAELPTLGICLGAQLLATAIGGRVAEMPGGPEVGLHTVTFSDAAAEDPLFGGLATQNVQAVQWHWLEAAALPEEVNVLASSGACRNQAFRVGAAAWGVQFHPEALGKTALDWANEEPESLVELGLDSDSVVAEVRQEEPELRTLWGDVADRFVNVAQEHASRER